MDQHRVENDHIEILYEEGSSWWTRGRLVAVSGVSLTVAFDPLPAVVGVPGAIGRVHFRVNDQRFDCGEVAACGREDFPHQTRISLEILVWPDVSLFWPPNIRALFNRRRADRVHPPPDADLLARIRARGFAPLEAEVADLSITGAGLLLPCDKLPYVELLPRTLSLDLMMPWERAPLSLRIEPMHHWLDGQEQLHLRIAFLKLDDPRYRGAQQKIYQFVMRCQQEERRARDLLA